MEGGKSSLTPFSELAWVGVVLLLAVVTRLVGLSWGPPAINQDEASNVYDAYCLLETGQDRWGEPWPIHLEAFGANDYRPALYAYLVIPFVWLLGPEHMTVAARMPAAGLGVLTILCFYLLVRRLCGRRTAWWAALLLVLSPWHLQISRYGHEGSLTPVFAILCMFALAQAGWPFGAKRDEAGPERRLRVGWVLAFSVLVALSLYSYGSMKLFVPAMLVVGVMLYRSVLWSVLRDKRNAVVVACGLVVVLVLSGPMVWETVTKWDQINSRAKTESLFHQGLPLGETLVNCGRQYFSHFGYRWLLSSGKKFVFCTTPGVGVVNWCVLPLAVLGLYVAWSRRSDNRLWMVLLAWLLLYPVASALTRGAPHPSRAACGIGVYPWLAAIGIDALIGWLGALRRNRLVVSGVVGVIVFCNGAWATYTYVSSYCLHPYVMNLMQNDLRDAVVSIRDRWRDYDRIFVSDHVRFEGKTVWACFQSYIYVLTYIPIHPEEFRGWDKKVGYVDRTSMFHTVEQMGPFVMSTRPEVLGEYFSAEPNPNALVISRPGDLNGGRLLHEIRGRDGELRYQVIEVRADAQNLRD